MALRSLKPRFNFQSAQQTPEFHYLFDKNGWGELEWWMLCELERVRTTHPLDYQVLASLVRHSDFFGDTPQARGEKLPVLRVLYRWKHYLAIRGLYAYLMRKVRLGWYQAGSGLSPLRTLLCLHRWARSYRFA
jgi:hypothetical protein